MTKNQAVSLGVFLVLLSLPGMGDGDLLAFFNVFGVDGFILISVNLVYSMLLQIFLLMRQETSMDFDQ